MVGGVFRRVVGTVSYPRNVQLVVLYAVVTGSTDAVGENEV